MGVRFGFAVFCSFLCGIGIHAFFALDRLPALFWYSLFGALFFVFLVGSRFLGFRALFCLFCFVFGFWRYEIALPFSVPCGSFQTYEGSVFAVSDFGYSPQLRVRLDGGGAVLLSVARSVPIGSRVTFSCSLACMDFKDADTAYDGARRWFWAQGRCRPAEVRVIRSPAWWDWRDVFLGWRRWAYRRVLSAIRGDAGALTAGILYGENRMSSSAQDLFRRAGLTHLIAVSGSNFAIVTSILFSVLLSIGLRRSAAYRWTTIAIILFAGFVGFSASVLRAGLMSWLVLTARRVGRIPHAFYLLAGTATVLCLFQPRMLAFDAGFALSFLATLGLMLWTPFFTRLLRFIPTTGGLQEAASATSAASLMTLPYIAVVFGRFSFSGVLINVFAVPLTPWLMLFGFISLLWGDLPGGFWISLPATGLARVLFWLAGLVDRFPWADFSVQLSFFWFFFFEGILFYLWIRYVKKFVEN